MKKLNIFFLLCMAITVALVSCGNDDDNNVPEPIDPPRAYANTVFVYMPWTGSETSSEGSLTSSFQQNIRDIKSAIRRGEGNTDTRTVVFFATSANSARLFEINDDGTETRIDSIATGAMTTTGDLTDILNRVKSYSPTSTYSIIIGAHANGWLPAGSVPQQSRAFGGRTKGLQTDITTLATAITQSGIGKMQYICFDDCYMANIESAYALRNATNWLIASTSEVMNAGLPYSDIWKYLSETNVDYSGIVNGFGSFYSSYSYPYGALSAIDCRQTETMAALMKALNEKYAGWDYDLSTIQSLDGYNTHVYYDMGDYINKVCGSDTIGNQQIYNELKELVPYKFTTPSLYSYLYTSGPVTFRVRSYSGIATSDPSQNDAAFDAKKNTEWWKATH